MICYSQITGITAVVKQTNPVTLLLNYNVELFRSTYDKPSCIKVDSGFVVLVHNHSQQVPNEEIKTPLQQPIHNIKWPYYILQNELI